MVSYQNHITSRLSVSLRSFRYDESCVISSSFLPSLQACSPVQVSVVSRTPGCQGSTSVSVPGQSNAPVGLSSRSACYIFSDTVRLCLSPPLHIIECVSLVCVCLLRWWNLAVGLSASGSSGSNRTGFSRWVRRPPALTAPSGEPSHHMSVFTVWHFTLLTCY